MTFWLVRHGATEWSESRRHTGRTDIELTELGRTQASALAPALAGRSFARVLTSPLVRARETARLAGFPDAEVTPALREVDYGDFEGLTREQIRQKVPGWDFFSAGPQSGESIAAAGERARGLIDSLSGDVLVFSHGHFLRILTAVFLEEEPAWGRHLTLEPASVSRLGRENDSASLVVWNERAHLTQK